MALNFDFSKVVGVCISHEHLDHSKYLRGLMNGGIPAFATTGTFESLNIHEYGQHHLPYRSKTFIGQFEVTAYQAIHDAKEPASFLIEHPEMGRMLFVTDTAQFNYAFKSINHLLIEANYDPDIVVKNAVQNTNYYNNIKRLMKTHMSLKECELACQNNVSEATKNIILIHLSDGNSDRSMFQKRIKMRTGKPVYVADETFELEL